MDNYIKNIGLNLADDTLNKLSKYADDVICKGEQFNLTSDLDKDVFIKKHIVDSIYLNKFVDFDKVGSVVDLGTGAGLPGMVLSIANQSTNFTLVDSLNKRINFLSDVVDELDLANVNLECMRAEEFTRIAEYRESFDVAVSRAVAPLNLLLEYVSPAIKVGGKFYAYKSQKHDEELEMAEKALLELNMKLIDKHEYNLLSGEYRVILEFEKIANTPDKYPRRTGIPSKRPIK